LRTFQATSKQKFSRFIHHSQIDITGDYAGTTEALLQGEAEAPKRLDDFQASDPLRETVSGDGDTTAAVSPDRWVIVQQRLLLLDGPTRLPPSSS
jgi:hypothetical protein